MKKVKQMALVLLACAMCLSLLAGCGPKEVARTMYSTNRGGFLESINWYWNTDYILSVYADDTYELIVKCGVFRPSGDPVGDKTIIYTGACTTAASADGDPTHLDVTISPATRIVMEQHGKCWGRMEIGVNTLLDTANWTDSMTSIAVPEADGDGAAAFLAKYAQSGVFTVQDMSLAPDDPTLVSYEIVKLPDVNFEIPAPIS